MQKFWGCSPPQLTKVVVSVAIAGLPVSFKDNVNMADTVDFWPQDPVVDNDV